MKVRKWPVVGLVLAVLWLFVRGVALGPRTLAGELLVGLVVGVGIAYGLRRMYEPTVDVGRSLRVGPLAAYYVALFLWEVLTANLDVAYRVLHPRMPLEPDVVEVPLRIETDAAITTIANSITLTPGTLTMDHDPETNTLYVHGIVGRRREQVLAPIRAWEDLLLVIFDESAAPDDEPPVPPSERLGEPAGATAAAEPSADGRAESPDGEEAEPEVGSRESPAGDETEPEADDPDPEVDEAEPAANPENPGGETDGG